MYFSSNIFISINHLSFILHHFSFAQGFTPGTMNEQKKQNNERKIYDEIKKEK